MGQGLFGAIGFGCILSEEQRGALYDEYGDLRVDVGGWENEPKRAYESDDEYLAYLIFDTSSYTSNGSNVRYAARLSDLADDTKRRYPDAYLNAEQRWSALVDAAHKIGVDLPAGELIYVHDYD